jgi:hypothetical protein
MQRFDNDFVTLALLFMGTDYSVSSLRSGAIRTIELKRHIRAI